MTFYGDPIVGQVPAQLIVEGSGGLTRVQMGFVQAKYAQFCTTMRLSIAPSLTLNYILPDGSKMRVTSIYGVASITVNTSSSSNLIDLCTFFCIPFDESYLSKQIKDTYGLKRWVDIGLSSPETLLNKLINLKKSIHPGNQTWFANIPGETKHEFANLVLSWWGHPNRYNYSPLDAFLMRTPPNAESLIGAGGHLLYPSGIENSHAIYPRAWEDAMSGKFYQLGETSSPEESSGINPPYASAVGLKAIWLNGVQFKTDFEVNSACIGKRTGLTSQPLNVVRIFSAPRETGGHITNAIQIIEFPLSSIGSMSGGTLRKSSATVFNLAIPFPEITGCENYATDYYCHPFYWNADGTEAMAILQFTCQFNAPPEQGTGIPVNYGVFGTSLLKLTKTKLGFDLSIMEFSGVTESLSKSSFAVMNGGIQFTGNSFDYQGVQSYPLAADYLGNSAKIIRGHISETVSSYDAVYSGNSAATVKSGVSFNEELISWLENTGTKSISKSTTSTDGSSDWGHISSSSETGRASRWAISGGDLRGGKIVLRESPWYLTECPVNLHASMWINSTTSSSTGWNYSHSHTETTFTGSDGYEYVKSYKDSYEYRLNINDSYIYSEDGGGFFILDTASSAIDIFSGMSHPINYKGLGSILVSDSADATWGYSWEIDPETGIVTEGGFGDYPYGGVTDPFGINPATPNYTETHTGLDENSVVGVFPVTIDSSLNAPGDPNYASRTSLRRYRSGLGIRARNAAYTGAGGYADVVFSSSAVSPDGKIQYIGLLSVALAAPNTKTPLPLFKLDKWYANGVEFIPTKDYPYIGNYKMLSSPVFVGPLPTKNK